MRGNEFIGRQLYMAHFDAACVQVYAESAEQANALCTWLKTSLVQTCYPLIDMADVERTDMMQRLKKSPIYRYEVKRMANVACKHLHDMVESSLGTYDTENTRIFSAKFGNGILADVEKIRNELSKYLQRNGSKYAAIIARVETVRALLQLATLGYDRVCDIVSQETCNGSLREMYGYMRAGSVLKEWDALSSAIAHRDPFAGRVDLGKCKAATDAVLELYKHAYEEDLIPDALRKAMLDGLEQE